MAEKLYLVEVSPEYEGVDRVMVKANSATAAKRCVLDAKLAARKVEAIEALALAADGVAILQAGAESADADPEQD